MNNGDSQTVRLSAKMESYERMNYVLYIFMSFLTSNPTR